MRHCSFLFIHCDCPFDFFLNPVSNSVLTPTTAYADIITAVFGSTAVVIIAIMGGIVFARLLSPRPQIRFSNVAIITNYDMDGRSYFQFRINGLLYAMDDGGRVVTVLALRVSNSVVESSPVELLAFIVSTHTFAAAFHGLGSWRRQPTINVAVKMFVLARTVDPVTGTMHRARVCSMHHRSCF